MADLYDEAAAAVVSKAQRFMLWLAPRAGAVQKLRLDVRRAEGNQDEDVSALAGRWVQEKGSSLPTLMPSHSVRTLAAAPLPRPHCR